MHLIPEDGLLDEQVHTQTLCLLPVDPHFRGRCHHAEERSREPVFSCELENLFDHLEAITNRHEEVHQNQTVWDSVLPVLVLKLFDSLLAIVGYLSLDPKDF